MHNINDSDRSSVYVKLNANDTRVLKGFNLVFSLILSTEKTILNLEPEFINESQRGYQNLRRG